MEFLEIFEKFHIPTSGFWIDWMRKLQIFLCESINDRSSAVAIDFILMVRQNLLVKRDHFSLGSSSLAMLISLLKRFARP
mgnify:CR=1 FL=1